MDETNQDQHEVRSVRRGRPPKVRIGPEQVVEPVQPEQVVSESIPPEPAAFENRQALSLAKRIWAGQSPDVPRKERLARVARGLEAQGFTMDGIEL